MNMTQTTHRVLLCGLMLAVVSMGTVVVAAEEQGQTKEQEMAQPQTGVKWDAAGQEVRKASDAVAEATRETAGTAWDALKNESVETWEKTRAGSRELVDTVGEKSKEVWQATKEESLGFWDKGKAKIHEVTAPAPPVVVPAAPPASPVAPGQPTVTPPAQ